MIVCVWPDGVWCSPDEVEEYMSAPCAKSDDFLHLHVSDGEDVDEAVNRALGGGARGKALYSDQVAGRTEELTALFFEVKNLWPDPMRRVSKADILALIERRVVDLQTAEKPHG